MLRDMITQELPKLLRFVKPSGNNNVGGPCPFHKGGQERNPSFYVNLDNGLFFCHSCGEKGTFVQLLKRLGARADKIELLMKLAEEEQPSFEKIRRANDHRATYVLSEAILGALDYCPEDLLAAGFEMDLLHKMDVGFDNETMRITYPIRDMYGTLVGIAGRTVTDAIPRYLVYRPQDLARFAPADDPEKYKWYHTPNNHHFVWNYHNVYPDLFYGSLNQLIVVEGYKACMWVIQHGYPNTVALMGSYLTPMQEALLTKFGGTIFLFLDHNKAGWTGTYKAGKALTRHGQDVRVVEYPPYVEVGAQPDNLLEEEIKAGLEKASPFAKWRRDNEAVIGRPQVTIETDRHHGQREQKRRWD